MQKELRQTRQDLEALEQRLLFSTFTVTSTADVAPGDPNFAGTLRWAVAQANAAAATAISPSFVAFDPAVFGVPALPRTITLTQGLLELTAGATTIVGPGANLLTVTSNHVFRILQVDATVTAAVSGLTIAGGNAGPSAGGGVFNVGTLGLTAAALTGNTAAGGGGIENVGSGVLTVAATTFSANAAPGAGGGALGNGTGAPATLANCTFSGNSAPLGGAIQSDGPLTLTDCTVSANTSAASGGGVYASAAATLNNTIVAGNTAPAGPDLYSLVSAGGNLASNGVYAGSNNLVGSSAGEQGLANGQSGNQVGTAANPLDPRLAPLADNGGPTQTMALLPGSPAIDAGSNAAVPPGVTADQRGGGPAGSAGYARVFNGTVDVGAYEASPPLPLVLGVTPQDPAGLAGPRSLVSQITVTFNEPIKLAAGAFTLGFVNSYGSGAAGSPDANASAVLGTPANPTGDGITWIVPVLQSGTSTTYSYNLLGGAASLQDGVYRLGVTAAAVTALADGRAMASPTPTPLFHRLFGDTDGNKTVNALDYARFKSAFGSSSGSAAYNADLDADGNGTVNAADYAQFKKRFGLTFGYP